MDEFIIRSLQARSSEEEEKRLRRWRAAAPDNDQRYRQLAAIWALVGVADPVRTDERAPDLKTLLAGAERGELRFPDPSDAPADALPFRRRPWFRRATRGAIAASLLGVGIGLGNLLDGGDPTGPLADSEIVTGAGEMTTLTLHDGTSIRIGPGSRMRVVEERHATLVRLDGRAFFGVQPGRAREFRVATAYGEAAVLGTRFEVRSEHAEFRVLVLDGEVRVSAGGHELGLTEGEMGRSVDGTPPTRYRVDDVYAHLDWMGNALVFQGTPLHRAVREIERRYWVKVLLEEDLADVAVTVTFTDETLNDVVLVLCEMVGAQCEVDERQVHVRRRASTAEIRSQTNL
jgi:transmembrane sensor